MVIYICASFLPDPLHISKVYCRLAFYSLTDQTQLHRTHSSVHWIHLGDRTRTIPFSPLSRMQQPVYLLPGISFLAIFPFRQQSEYGVLRTSQSYIRSWYRFV